LCVWCVCHSCVVCLVCMGCVWVCFVCVSCGCVVCVEGYIYCVCVGIMSICVSCVWVYVGCFLCVMSVCVSCVWVYIRCVGCPLRRRTFKVSRHTEKGGPGCSLQQGIFPLAGLKWVKKGLTVLPRLCQGSAGTGAQGTATGCGDFVLCLQAWHPGQKGPPHWKLPGLPPLCFANTSHPQLQRLEVSSAAGEESHSVWATVEWTLSSPWGGHSTFPQRAGTLHPLLKGPRKLQPPRRQLPGSQAQGSTLSGWQKCPSFLPQHITSSFI
jgi:hypothetical protein